MNQFNRVHQIEQLNEADIWDVIVVGGGATGLGSAVEAATRGLKTLLLEQSDFTKGTSSRSTKLVHGGVRYLAQGNISLVLEALNERGLMKQNAPHLIKNQKFIIPAYKWWVKPYYTIGLSLYDFMAGRLGYGRSLPYSKKHTLASIPTLKTDGLRGGVVYHDGQFDDARYGISLFQTLIENGGFALNYFKVVALQKSNAQISGVIAVDMETKQSYPLNAKAVINATGVFVDEIMKMDNLQANNVICASQGVHLVLDKCFIPNDIALMIPKTSDGRVLFAVPWHDKVVVGTTDIEKQRIDLEPIALEEEVDFILETASRFLQKAPQRSDVKSVFAGLRPLVAPTNGRKNTKELSRGHKIIVAKSGLISITGGKWTTYRKMGQDVINTAVRMAQLPAQKSVSNHLHLHGWVNEINLGDPLYVYGADADLIRNLVRLNNDMGICISEELNIIKAQVVWAVKFEMARTIEDFLARRTRALFLNAKESVRMAPEVANIMAVELGRDAQWAAQQIAQFEALASNYILN